MPRLQRLTKAWNAMPDRGRVAASLITDALLIGVAAGVARLLSMAISLIYPEQGNQDVVVPILQWISSISTVGAFALYTLRDLMVTAIMVGRECRRVLNDARSKR
jgi:hypothetical protein